MGRSARSLGGFVLLLWILLVISGYFVVQKPWALASGLDSLMSLADCLLAAAILVSAGGIGRLLLGPLEPFSRLEAVTAQAGIGLGIFSIVILLAGLTHVIHPASAWLLLLAALIGTYRVGTKWALDLRQGLLGGGKTDGIERAAQALVVFLLVLSLLDALAPPLKWDSLVYHLALPKHYLAVHSVDFVSGNLFGGFPQLPEMLYTWAMGLRAGTTATLLGWGAGVLAMLGVAGLIERGLVLNRRWLTIAIVFSGASLWQGLSWAYVDHWVLLYGVILISALDVHTRRRTGPWLLLAGMAIGFAASSKYTAILLGPAAVLWFLADALTAARGTLVSVAQESDTNPEATASSVSSFARNSAIVGLIGLALFAPWLVKNLILTGNPAYPFLWPGRELDALRQSFHAKGESTSSLLDALLLPWRATVLGVEGGAGFNTSIGPLYLALIPGLFLGLRSFEAGSRRLLHRASLLAVMTWVAWGAGEFLADPLIRSRHYYGFLPVMALLAVAGFQNMLGLRLGDLRLGWVISRLVLFSLFLTAVGGLFHFAAQDPVPVIVGERSQEDYLADQLGWFGPAMSFLGTLPPNARVQMLWEARSYYCPRDCIPDEILDKWWHLRRTLGDNRQIARSWSEQGVSYVLIYDFGADFERRTNDAFDASDWQALESFREQYLQQVKVFGDGYSLYGLKDPADAAGLIVSIAGSR